MGLRRGVFTGAYVPENLKKKLAERAASEHRTLSQEITRILTKEIYGKPLSFDEVDKMVEAQK